VKNTAQTALYLTVREKQIATRLLKGQKRSLMADELQIHIRTVDFHLVNLRRKVRVNSMLELALHLIRLNGAFHGKGGETNGKTQS
jgi:DNA-binding CsgD family transcriptional regulator